MAGDASAAQLKAELKEVESDLANIRKTAEEIRSGVGEADDPADRGQLIQSAAEQDALAEGMEQRRRDLLRRISEAG
jgi:type II secretory pathway component PulM